jgi:hypothetical protein
MIIVFKMFRHFFAAAVGSIVSSSGAGRGASTISSSSSSVSLSLFPSSLSTGLSCSTIYFIF